ADRNRSHWSTSKTPSYTKSVSWQHHRHWDISTVVYPVIFFSILASLAPENLDNSKNTPGSDLISLW
ncbi:hypothetical protein, partial [Escherichia coli]|uniref:hypothetical protein n=1 Tax=Escherichia coli TaxID=562 RepID=UPI001BC887C9